MSREDYLKLHVVSLKHFGIGDFKPAKGVNLPKYSNGWTGFHVLQKIISLITLFGGAMIAETTSDFSLCCSEFLNMLLGCIKFTVLVMHRNRVYKLMKVIEIDRLDYFDDDRFMEAGKSGTRKIFMTYMILSVIWLIGYYTTSFRGEDVEVDSKWSLMSLYTPYDFYVKGRFGVIEFFLTILIMYQAYCLLFIDIFSASIFIFIAQQFKTVAYMFETIQYNDPSERDALQRDTENVIGRSDHEGRPKMPNDLRKAIAFHIILLECANDLQIVWRYIFFFQVLESYMPLCFCLYLILNTVNFTYDDLWDTCNHFIYLVYLLYQLYLITSCADQTRDQALLVSEGAYSGQWTIGSVAARKDLINVIHRANKPLLFTALGFYSMDMETFIAILRAAYAAFALMRNFT